jgi:hypothetical protein
LLRRAYVLAAAAHAGQSRPSDGAPFLAHVVEVASLLHEDGSIESFAERKRGLREQVRAAGRRAITIFAADKLSDIRGLQRGIDRFGDSLEARIGTTVDGMAGHYRESVEMIEASQPDSLFLPALLAELGRHGRPAAQRA